MATGCVCFFKSGALLLCFFLCCTSGPVSIHGAWAEVLSSGEGGLSPAEPGPPINRGQPSLACVFGKPCPLKACLRVIPPKGCQKPDTPTHLADISQDILVLLHLERTSGYASDLRRDQAAEARRLRLALCPPKYSEEPLPIGLCARRTDAGLAVDTPPSRVLMSHRPSRYASFIVQASSNPTAMIRASLPLAARRIFSLIQQTSI